MLAGNSLDGSVPAELGGICSLLELDLMGNRLGGELPLAVIRLKAAERCDTRLSQNHGFTLPNDLAALDIVDLDFSHCSLHGSSSGARARSLSLFLSLSLSLSNTHTPHTRLSPMRPSRDASIHHSRRKSVLKRDPPVVDTPPLLKSIKQN